jgi:hypothetical protein
MSLVCRDREEKGDGFIFLVAVFKPPTLLAAGVFLRLAVLGPIIFRLYYQAFGPRLGAED